MAGIGFELRRLLQKDTLLGMVRAYAYAGIIGSGPWVLSILGILVIGLFSIGVVVPKLSISQFQITITYLIATSLVFTGVLQLAFTRFCADRSFEKREDLILPNFGGVTLIITALAGVLCFVVSVTLFSEQSLLFRGLLIACFVVLSNIWIATVFLSGMKQYQAILLLYAAGYGITVAAALALRDIGLEGLLLGFLVGQVALLAGMLVMIVRGYPAPRLVSFKMFSWSNLYPSLMITGLMYNAGVWADKFMFWYFPGTGSEVIGPLHASVIYDIPVFLAYLSLIPGMAVFLVRMETDFVEYYANFFDAVRDGGSLNYIEDMRNQMTHTVRQGVFQILKIQAIASMVLMVSSPRIFAALEISPLYLPLLKVQLVATALQVVFLAIINVFCYLDQRRMLVLLTTLFFVLNIIFTGLSLKLGPQFFGYGYLLSLAVCVILGLWLVNRRLATLEYETFMLH